MDLLTITTQLIGLSRKEQAGTITSLEAERLAELRQFIKDGPFKGIPLRVIDLTGDVHVS
jgi:hypothetical protein